VAFEYPGFGADTPKNVSITGAVDAMLGVYSNLVTQKRHVIVFGYSMGTGVTSEMVRRLHDDPQLASIPKPVGIVLQSAFESVLRTSATGLLNNIVMKTLRIGGYDAYPTHKFISKLSGVPVIAFMHGNNDKRANITGAKHMADKVANNGTNQVLLTYWDAYADHTDLPLRKRFSTFLEKVVCDVQKNIKP
jgi:pimeloyl-ACP methyl ester carboxylesterase